MRLEECSSGSMAIAGSKFLPLLGRCSKLAVCWLKGMVDRLKFRVEPRLWTPDVRIGIGLEFSTSATCYWKRRVSYFKNLVLSFKPRLVFERDFCIKSSLFVLLVILLFFTL